MSDDTENFNTFEEGDGSVMIDLQNVEDVVDEVIPKGKYEGVIDTCDFAYSQASGQPMWALKLKLVGGEYDGRVLYNYLSFSPKAIGLTKKTLVKIAPELLEGPFDAESKASSLEGRPVRVVTKIETYEGNKRTAVQRLEPSGELDAFMSA